MSDALQHECGIALVRLLKPLEFYKEKYGTAFYGMKMYLLMENNTIEDKMVLVLQV
jgi:amidophosphoribosyltransferase